MPIRLKVRFFDDEVQLVVYNTLSLFLLLQKLADVTSMPSNSFKVKAIEQQRIFRIDNKAENDEIKATISLKDLEIYDGTPLMIELKEEGDDVGADEAQPEAQDDAGDGQSQAKPKEEHVLLDDTPNLRTALVEKANEAGVEVMQVDILKMTIKDLTEKICKEFFLKAPQRLLNLTTSRYYTKEDENKLLCEFEQF